jgi:hypothetical protein
MSVTKATKMISMQTQLKPWRGLAKQNQTKVTKKNNRWMWA